MQQAMHIFTAGVAIQLVQETIRQWDSAHPELPAVMVPGGSVDLIRKCRAGEPCDLPNKIGRIELNKCIRKCVNAFSYFKNNSCT